MILTSVTYVLNRMKNDDIIELITPSTFSFLADGRCLSRDYKSDLYIIVINLNRNERNN